MSGYGTTFTGNITIRPAPPAAALAGTPFDSYDNAWASDADIFIAWDNPWTGHPPPQPEDAAYIEILSEERHGDRTGIREALQQIVALLGDGYTFTGSFDGTDNTTDTDNQFRITIRDGLVLDQAGTVVYGLGSIGSDMAGDDIETALATFAEMWSGDGEADLSSRQAEVAQLVHGLWVDNSSTD